MLLLYGGQHAEAQLVENVAGLPFAAEAEGHLLTRGALLLLRIGSWSTGVGRHLGWLVGGINIVLSVFVRVADGEVEREREEKSRQL